MMVKDSSGMMWLVRNIAQLFCEMFSGCFARYVPCLGGVHGVALMV